MRQRIGMLGYLAYRSTPPALYHYSYTCEDQDRSDTGPPTQVLTQQ
jgi:hypothetical protein